MKEHMRTIKLIVFLNVFSLLTNHILHSKTLFLQNGQNKIFCAYSDNRWQYEIRSSFDLICLSSSALIFEAFIKTTTRKDLFPYLNPDNIGYKFSGGPKIELKNQKQIFFLFTHWSFHDIDRYDTIIEQLNTLEIKFNIKDKQNDRNLDIIVGKTVYTTDYNYRWLFGIQWDTYLFSFKTTRFHFCGFSEIAVLKNANVLFAQPELRCKIPGNPGKLDIFIGYLTKSGISSLSGIIYKGIITGLILNF